MHGRSGRSCRWFECAGSPYASGMKIALLPMLFDHLGCRRTVAIGRGLPDARAFASSEPGPRRRARLRGRRDRHRRCIQDAVPPGSRAAREYARLQVALSVMLRLTMTLVWNMLAEINLFALLVIALAGFFTCLELGFRLGQRRLNK